MKSKFIGISLLLFLVVQSLGAAYPDLSQQVMPSLAQPDFEREKLDQFLLLWAPEQGPSLKDLADSLEKRVEETNLDARQLATVVAIQQAQLDYSLENRKPKIGITAAPYSYADTTVPSGLGSTSRTQKHTFSLGSSLTQSLPTGGQVNLSVKQSSTYESYTSSAWTQSPSLSVSLSQPLWVGEGILDTNFQAKQLQKQELSLENNQSSLKALTKAMVLQNLQLLSVRQSLLENRYLIAERANLAYELVGKAEGDLRQGLISNQAYESRLLSYYQSALAYENLSDEIEKVQQTLSPTWADGLPPYISLSIFNVESLVSELKKGDVLLSRYLLQDAAYKEAVSQLRSATLDSGFYSLSDAPLLQLSFQLSPFYTATTNASFIDSFSQMFSNSKPLLSFSIGFSATDLFRRATKVQQQSAEQALLAAKAKVQQAYEMANDAIRTLQVDVSALMMKMALQLREYDTKQVLLETEQIRFSAGISDATSLKTKELDLMQSAFTVLSTLRELENLYLKMYVQALIT